MSDRIDFRKLPGLTDFRNQLAAEDSSSFVDKLIAALRHPVADRAGLAIDICLASRLHEPRAIARFIALLSASKDAATLKQAALALGQFGDARAVEPLRALRAQPATPLVARLAAVVALRRLAATAPAPPCAKRSSTPTSRFETGRRAVSASKCAAPAAVIDS